MMSSTLGAPLGGTTRGGHHGLEFLASRLIVPPNVGGGGGRYFPSIVVVALGDPGAAVRGAGLAATGVRCGVAAGKSGRRSRTLAAPCFRCSSRVTSLPW